MFAGKILSEWYLELQLSLRTWGCGVQACPGEPTRTRRWPRCTASSEAGARLSWGNQLSWRYVSAADACGTTQIKVLISAADHGIKKDGDRSFTYLQVQVRVTAGDPGPLGLSERYEDEGRQGYLGVVATETTLKKCTEKRFILVQGGLKGQDGLRLAS